MAKNKVEEVRASIQKMCEDKARELAKIDEKIRQAEQAEEKAAAEMHEAVVNTNIGAYAIAKEAQTAANTTLEMYRERRRQLDTKQFVTEEESDATIDALLDYEKQLTANFIAAIREPLDKLATLQENYAQEIAQAEATIIDWTGRIHANYSTRGGTFFADGTDRSPEPVPVRRIPYTGAPASEVTANYIHKVREVMEM